MNKALLLPAVQKFVDEHLQDDIPQLILKGSPFPEVSAQELAVQISGRKKAKAKLPSWFQNPNILYPPNINLEQTSSEVTAAYKSKLVEGDTIADLTGGFGIDSFYFSKKFQKVFHFEKNTELSQLAAHNFSQLNAENIYPIAGDAIDHLMNFTGRFDYIYLDPSRRDDYGGKVFHLNQCTPDVSEQRELFFSKTENILLKTSPLLDLKAGLTELKGVFEIHIIAVNNDVKELLWLLKKGSTGNIRLKTINIQSPKDQVFYTDLDNDQTGVPLGLPEKYLFEPNAAIMKSGMFKELALETGTKKLHPNSHLFTSSEIVKFPGRIFEIIDYTQFNRKNLKKKFKDEKANITTRNFPVSVENIKKEFGIKDGGENYLFFSTDLNENKIVLECRKIQQKE